VSGSGISWTICKSALRSRQITTPAPHHSFFTGQMPFLPPSQQRQSTAPKKVVENIVVLDEERIRRLGTTKKATLWPVSCGAVEDCA